MGITVLDPCDKPINFGIEDLENIKRRKELKQEGEYDTVANLMKIIRTVDLRMVDISDFLIVYLDLDITIMGTAEELFLANRQKKPILVVCKQGKHNIPDWLFGTLPHEMMFGCFSEILNYLKSVDDGTDDRTFKRWFFFNQDMLTAGAV